MSMLFGMLFTTNVTGWMHVMIKMPNSIPMHMHLKCSLYVVCYRKGIELVMSNLVVLQWYINLNTGPGLNFDPRSTKCVIIFRSGCGIQRNTLVQAKCYAHLKSISLKIRKFGHFAELNFTAFPLIQGVSPP